MNKQEFRHFFLEKRRIAEKTDLKMWSKQIAEHIFNYIEEHDISFVMVYASFCDEPDTMELIHRLMTKGICVGLPVCSGHGRMEAYQLLDEKDLHPGTFGILQPSQTKLLSPEDFQLVLVPGCVFGWDMSRIGYGAGYYDRYLPKCKNAILAGVTYSMCVTNNLPQEDQDVKMNLLFTEQGIVQ